MKKMMLILILVLLIAGGVTLVFSRSSSSDADVSVAETVPPSEAEPAGAAEVSNAAEVPAPEVLKTRILDSVCAYHPGTAGASLKLAESSAQVFAFITESHFSSLDGGLLSENLTASWQSLSEEEQVWFRENLPVLVGQLEEAIADPAAVEGLYSDAGAAETLEEALSSESVREDWDAFLRLPLIQTILEQQA